MGPPETPHSKDTWPILFGVGLTLLIVALFVMGALAMWRP